MLKTLLLCGAVLFGFGQAASAGEFLEGTPVWTSAGASAHYGLWGYACVRRSNGTYFTLFVIATPVQNLPDTEVVKEGDARTVLAMMAANSARYNFNNVEAMPGYYESYAFHGWSLLYANR